MNPLVWWRRRREAKRDAIAEQGALRQKQEECQRQARAMRRAQRARGPEDPEFLRLGLIATALEERGLACGARLRGDAAMAAEHDAEADYFGRRAAQFVTPASRQQPHVAA
jgi:hypothetical protein